MLPAPLPSWPRPWRDGFWRARHRRLAELRLARSAPSVAQDHGRPDADRKSGDDGRRQEAVLPHTAEREAQVDPQIFSLGIPILGICYGLMQMAHHLGGSVRFTGRREYGAGTLEVTNGSQLFDGLGNSVDVWNSHGDEVTKLPAGFRVAARTEGSPLPRFHHRGREWSCSHSWALASLHIGQIHEEGRGPLDRSLYHG